MSDSLVAAIGELAEEVNKLRQERKELQDQVHEQAHTIAGLQGRVALLDHNNAVLQGMKAEFK